MQSELKPEVVFKVQKMAQYASFCLTMGPFKAEVPVFFARLWPVMVMGLVLRLQGGHPSVVAVAVGRLAYGSAADS